MSVDSRRPSSNALHDSSLELLSYPQLSSLPSQSPEHQRTEMHFHHSQSEFLTHRHCEMTYRESCSNLLSLGLTRYQVRITDMFSIHMESSLPALHLWLTHMPLARVQSSCLSVVARVTESPGTGGGSRLFTEVPWLLSLEETVGSQGLIGVKGLQFYLQGSILTPVLCCQTCLNFPLLQKSRHA